MMGAEGMTPALLAGVTLVTMVGATLQGTVGFGLGVFAVPVLLLIAPAMVPGPILAASVVLTLFMTHRDRRAILVRDLKWALTGRVAGVAAGLGLLVVVPADRLGAVLGGLVVMGVLMTVARAHLAITPGTLVGAGALSGLMGTAAAVGGPPMALLYQRESGPRVRGTLSAYFLIGILMSLTGLHFVGRFGVGELRGTALLLPGTILGFLLSRRTAVWLDRGYTRTGILAVSAVTGLLVIVQHSVAAANHDHPLRVVTYNIRHGRGMDDSLDLARTAAVLRRLNPDIVGLQEVDSMADRSGGVDQADSLGSLLGMRHAFGGFMSYQGGAYGMAILSRHPIRRVIPVRLPDGNEPRIALAVEVEMPDGARVTVINVHFDWVEDDAFRFAQATALTGYLDTLSGPHILMGDFNDTPGSRTLALFVAPLVAAGKPPADRFTFSSTEPEREIDYLFVAPRAAWTIRSVRVVDEPLASDHRPVTVELGRR